VIAMRQVRVSIYFAGLWWRQQLGQALVVVKREEEDCG
jgi:hypothetical protein